MTATTTSHEFTESSDDEDSIDDEDTIFSVDCSQCEDIQRQWSNCASDPGRKNIRINCIKTAPAPALQDCACLDKVL